MELFSYNASAPMASYAHVLQQLPKLSTLEALWEAHYAYWDNDILATGMLIPFILPHIQH